MSAAQDTAQGAESAGDQILWEFLWDCGRNGSIESYFVATEAELQAVLGEEVYLGDVLGKHSDISGVLEAADFKEVSRDQTFVAQFQELIGSTGICPLDYIEG